MRLAFHCLTDCHQTQERAFLGPSRGQKWAKCHCNARIFAPSFFRRGSGRMEGPGGGKKIPYARQQGRHAACMRQAVSVPGAKESPLPGPLGGQERGKVLCFTAFFLHAYFCRGSDCKEGPPDALQWPLGHLSLACSCVLWYRFNVTYEHNTTDNRQGTEQRLR